MYRYHTVRYLRSHDNVAHELSLSVSTALNSERSDQGADPVDLAPERPIPTMGTNAMDQNPASQPAEEADVIHSESEVDAGIQSGPEESQNEGDDPVVREYDVFLNDSLSEKLMLLQYPNRDGRQPYTERNFAKPLELRIKPGAGLIEVDVPMEIFDNYDKEKAVRFGDALKKSTDERAGGSLGLPGGFGVTYGHGRVGGAGRVPRRGHSDHEQEITQDMLHRDFDLACSLGRVLNKQTLGGQIDPLQDGKPIYMIGAFQDGRSSLPSQDLLCLSPSQVLTTTATDQLHITPIDSIAQLRPQFHHLDAVAEQEKAAARPQRDPGAAGRVQEARAVQMTAKSADGDDMDTAEVTKFLKAAQEENWKRLMYADEDVWTRHALCLGHSLRFADIVKDSRSLGCLREALCGQHQRCREAAITGYLRGVSGRDKPSPDACHGATIQESIGKESRWKDSARLNRLHQSLHVQAADIYPATMCSLRKGSPRRTTPPEVRPRDQW